LIYYTQRIFNWLSSRRLVIVSVGLATEVLQLSLYQALTVLIRVWAL